MKKLVVLIIFTLFTLTACSAAPEPAKRTTIPSSSIHDCTYYPTLVELDEYNNFVESSELIPVGFIHWDDVAILGEFRAFILNGKDRYAYAFENGGAHVNLVIDHSPASGNTANDSVSMVQISEEMANMCSSPNGGECIIMRSGFEYYYMRNGKLLRITWNENGIQYKLTGDFAAWHETENGISRLLSVSDDVANAAMAEIRQNLNHETS